MRLLYKFQLPTEASKGSNLSSVEALQGILLASFSLNIDAEKITEKMMGLKFRPGEQVEGDS